MSCFSFCVFALVHSFEVIWRFSFRLQISELIYSSWQIIKVVWRCGALMVCCECMSACQHRKITSNHYCFKADEVPAEDRVFSVSRNDVSDRLHVLWAEKSVNVFDTKEFHSSHNKREEKEMHQHYLIKRFLFMQLQPAAELHMRVRAERKMKQNLNSENAIGQISQPGET